MPVRSGVTVLGSANLDVALRVPQMPSAGETVLSAPRLSGPGGKGLNQAVAAARAGASTRFVGAVGTDPEGAHLLAVLAAEGIEALVQTTPGRTGLAVVIVDAFGENVIVVDPGANHELAGVGPSGLAAITAANVLLMQLEIPQPTVAEAAGVARTAGTTVMLNAAPHAPLDVRLCDSIDLLLVNEGEARAIAADTSSGRPGDRPGSTADAVDRDVDRLLERVPAVLVTLGPRGALYRDRAGARHYEPARPVTVVDTTAAGDTFAGYLAAALAEGIPVPAALARANAAAALAVGRRGAVAAVPRRADVDGLAAG